MSRYTGPVCRLCRAEGTKLFLKGDRCYTERCAMAKRNSKPGQHGTRRTKTSEYGLRLREKQKLRRFYGLNESQFAQIYEKAAAMPGKRSLPTFASGSTATVRPIKCLKDGCRGHRPASRRTARFTRGTAALWWNSPQRATL